VRAALEQLPVPVKDILKGAFSFSASLTGTLLRVSTREKAAALTFDDGPDPEWSPRFFELLEEHGARGTFFMVGKAARRHPELVARAAAAGHAVGNHTWDHPSLPLLTGSWRRTQLRWCREALGPHGSNLFRPPYGHQTPASQLDAARLGYRAVAWDVIAEDWTDDPAEILLARVERHFRPGSIVLFHDSLYTTVNPAHRDRRPTLEAVRRLLAGHRDFRFVTVPELLALGRPYKWHWYHRPDLGWLHRLV